MLPNSLDLNQVTCQNCGFIDFGHFCSSCGKTLKKNRISMNVIFASIGNAITGIEHKYIQTVKGMVLRPVAFIEEYINGRRDKYILPIKFYLFNIGLNLFVYSYFNIEAISINAADAASDPDLKYQSEIMFDQIIGNYGNLFLLCIIPVFVFASRILFPKSNYNSAEKATAITYMLGIVLFFEVFLNLIAAAFNPFYFVGRQIVRGLEIAAVVMLSYKFYNQNILNTIWKSLIIIATIVFSMKLVLMGFMEILIMICQE